MFNNDEYELYIEVNGTNDQVSVYSVITLFIYKFCNSNIAKIHLVQVRLTCHSSEIEQYLDVMHIFKLFYPS